jgi:hypothetical protein
MRLSSRPAPPGPKMIFRCTELVTAARHCCCTCSLAEPPLVHHRQSRASWSLGRPHPTYQGAAFLANEYRLNPLWGNSRRSGEATEPAAHFWASQHRRSSANLVSLRTKSPRQGRTGGVKRREGIVSKMCAASKGSRSKRGQAKKEAPPGTSKSRVLWL